MLAFISCLLFPIVNRRLCVYARAVITAGRVTVCLHGDGRTTVLPHH